MIYCVYKIEWVPRNRGPVDQPPLGYTYHRDKNYAEKCLKESNLNKFYKAKEPALCEVSPDVYNEVQEKDFIWAHPRKHI